MTVLASSLAAQTVQTPHDAVLDLYFAQSPEEVEQHLLKSTKDQLRQLDPSIRQAFFDSVMVRQDVEKQGLVSKRGGQGHTVLVFQVKDDPAVVANVTVEKEEINGDEAVVEAALHENGEEKMLLTFHLRKEEGQWRLAWVDIKQAPNTISLLGQLDSPHFAETVKSAMEGRGGTPDAAEGTTRNEAGAIGSLRTLNTAEITYLSTFSKGFSPDLKSLGGSGPTFTGSSAGLIDEALASRKKFGYTLTYTVVSKDRNGAVTAYNVSARPDTYGKTGKSNYFTDQTGVIRVTQEDRAATAADPPYSQ
jgi:hypothetical protein